MIRDRVREKIARTDYEFGSPKSYWNWDKVSDKDKAWYLRKANAILAIKELAVVDRDAELPSFRNAVNKSYNDYMLGQEDMLKPDAEGRHFVKVIPKPR